MRFDDRADRTVEYLRLMKEIWKEPRVSFEGRFARVAEAGGVRPQPVRKHIPIWIGGHTRAALARVVDIGDGWHPLGLRPPVKLYPAEMAAAVRRLRDMAATARRIRRRSRSHSRDRCATRTGPDAIGHR